MWIWIAKNTQLFTQKDLTEVKIFQNVLRGILFWNTLYTHSMQVMSQHVRLWLFAYRLSNSQNWQEVEPKSNATSILG